MLSKFGMSSCKPVNLPLGNHFKLSSEQSPQTEAEKVEMELVPYANVVGSLMYFFFFFFENR